MEGRHVASILHHVIAVKGSSLERTNGEQTARKPTASETVGGRIGENFHCEYGKRTEKRDIKEGFKTLETNHPATQSTAFTSIPLSTNKTQLCIQNLQSTTANMRFTSIVAIALSAAMATSAAVPEPLSGPFPSPYLPSQRTHI